jgi:nitrate reductase gamma subunit
LLLLVFVYFSIASFIGFSIYKAVNFARMPLHSRWELYPVPREGRVRARYGGSYYEEFGWWEKTRQISLAGEMKEMLKEMLFIKNLFVHQQKLWWISYFLHLGIYLLCFWTILLLIGAGIELAGINVTRHAGIGVALVYYCTLLSGASGALLVTFGSIGLFLRRLCNSTHRKYTTLQEYFNLFFIFIAVFTGILVWSGDIGFNYGREIMKNLLTFYPIKAGNVLTVHILLLGALLIYIPQTKMSHYIGKYFSFHKVLWDNEPNLRYSKMEERVKRSLDYNTNISWSAPHINSNSSKTDG